MNKSKVCWYFPFIYSTSKFISKLKVNSLGLKWVLLDTVMCSYRFFSLIKSINKKRLLKKQSFKFIYVLKFYNPKAVFTLST